jgi:hypothetical protein
MKKVIKVWPYWWNNGIGLGIIVWYSGAEIVLGPLMLKIMWYDRKAAKGEKAVG